MEKLRLHVLPIGPVLPPKRPCLAIANPTVARSVHLDQRLLEAQDAGAGGQADGVVEPVNRQLAQHPRVDPHQPNQLA